MQFVVVEMRKRRWISCQLEMHSCISVVPNRTLGRWKLVCNFGGAQHCFALSCDNYLDTVVTIIWRAAA